MAIRMESIGKMPDATATWWWLTKWFRAKYLCQRLDTCCRIGSGVREPLIGHRAPLVRSIGCDVLWAASGSTASRTGGDEPATMVREAEPPVSTQAHQHVWAAGANRCATASRRRSQPSSEQSKPRRHAIQSPGPPRPSAPPPTVRRRAHILTREI